ncbi:MAG: ATP-binding protein, partial [Pseudomonadota bacterium]
QSFLEEVRERYAGTLLGRQELDGILVDEVDGALWTPSSLEACHSEKLPDLDRIVVAIDPPTTSKAGSDECGIVVSGIRMQGELRDWRAVVLEDCSMSAASPSAWATAAISAMEKHGADQLVAEVNQGGEMVEQVVRQIDPLVPFKSVHASRGKSARAEPVAALYEQGRVLHTRGLDALEEQMCAMTRTGYEGKGSPDRVDALVWALTELMLVPAAKWRHPRVRSVY